MSLHHIGRAVVGSLFIVLFGGSSSHAIQAESPTAFIRSLGEETIQTLGDDALTEKQRIIEFRRLFIIGLDFRTLGRFVLGPHWRRATREEIREFEPLFAEYVVTTYAIRLARYEVDALRIGEVREDGRGGAIVTSEVVRRGAAPARIEWRIRGRPGNYKIVDVVVEGISMAITQRSEFASVIQRSGGDFDSLLTQLRKRTRQN